MGQILTLLLTPKTQVASQLMALSVQELLKVSGHSISPHVQVNLAHHPLLAA